MHVTALLDAKGRDVITIHERQSVASAIDLMSKRRVGALVVTGATPPLVGIVSERDIVNFLSTRGPQVLTNEIITIMTTTVTVCHPGTSCTTLMGMMTEQRIRHVPVLDNDTLVGLVSIGDIVKARFDELEREKRDLLEYVSAR